MKQYYEQIQKIKILNLLLSFIAFSAILCPCMGADDYYERFDSTSSLSPVGSGARALGMGGAFIAIADDATAASWNPGGLVQLEKPEISFVTDSFHRIEDNTSGVYPEISGDQTVFKARLNYFSAAWPFKYQGHHMIVSVNYQNLYDLTRKWNFHLVSESGNENIDFQQEGKLSAIGIAYSVLVTPRFSLGATFNIWNSELNKWDQKELRWGFDNNENKFQNQFFDEYSLSGFNFNLGLLWDASDDLTIGAVFKSPFKASLTHERKEMLGGELTVSGMEETMHMPMSFGMGFAYKFSRALTGSLDIYRTEWDDFIHTDSDGNETSPITGLSVAESDIKPTHQVRVGAEYLFITSKYIIPLCAGVFYDPAPGKGNPDDFFGFSIGSGIGWKQFHFDFAYQYRFGNNVDSSMLKAWDFSQDVEEHTVFSSVIIHF